MMINKKKKNLKENVLRLAIRKEIKKIMEAEEEQAPEEAPEEEPAEEEDYSQYESIAQNMVKRVRDSGVSVGNEELIVIVSNFIEAFTQGSEQKLSVLKGIKSNIVR